MVPYSEDDIASLSEGDTGIQKEITSRLAEAQQREDQAAAVADAIAGLEKDLEILAQDTLSTDRMRAERLERLTALQKEIADLRVETVASKSVIETMDERENFIRESLPAELAEAAVTDRVFRRKRLDLEDRDWISTSSSVELDNGAENRVRRPGSQIVSPGIAQVLSGSDASHLAELRGIVGTVGSLLTVGEGLETAIETALGAAIQNIVVDDERSAKSAIGFLRD